MNIKISRHLEFYVKILFSFFLIAAIFYKVDLGSLYDKLSLLPGYIFFILCLLVCLQFFVNVFIKNTMFSIFGFREKIFLLYKKIFKGAFYGMFMPSVVGGDAYYTYHFGKKFNCFSKILAGIFLVKLIGISVFFLFSFIVVLFYKDTILANFTINGAEVKNLFLVMIFVIFGLILFFTFFYKKFYSQYKRVTEKVNLIKNDIVNNRGKLLSITAFTMLFYIISIGGRVILGEIIGIDLPFFQLAGIVMIVNFLILIPVSINGVGVREGSYVTLMGFFGIDSITALTMSFLDFSITLISVFIGGIFVVVDNLRKNNYKK